MQPGRLALALCLLARPAMAAAAPYLDPAALPDAASLLPPPPAPGSDGHFLDDATFLRTRPIRQRDPARWAALARQTLLTPQTLPQSFEAALGAPINATATPALLALWRRAATDIERQVASAQDRYRRRRPFLHVHQSICVPRFTRLDRSPSYPSRVAALAWSLALILAEAAPRRAGAVLARGQEIGDSRVACGVNWQSDVAAGRLDAAALIAVLHSSDAFRSDLAQSRAEIARAAAARDTGSGMSPRQGQGSALDPLKAEP